MQSMYLCAVVTEKDILAYCTEAHGTILATKQGETNIIYVEGMNLDFTLNNDAPNKFNDLRLVFVNDADGDPILKGKWRATTEPGTTSTNSQQAAILKGVARIEFGYWHQCWVIGTHKEKGHPALVQSGPIGVHRDLNRDGFRTGEKTVYNVQGLNQHGPAWSFIGDEVNNNSAGCLVGIRRMEHEAFMRMVCNDPRNNLGATPLEGMKWKISTTVCDGTKLAAFAAAHK